MSVCRPGERPEGHRDKSIAPAPGPALSPPPGHNGLSLGAMENRAAFISVVDRYLKTVKQEETYYCAHLPMNGTCIFQNHTPARVYVALLSFPGSPLGAPLLAFWELTPVWPTAAPGQVRGQCRGPLR